MAAATHFTYLKLLFISFLPLFSALWRFFSLLFSSIQFNSIQIVCRCWCVRSRLCMFEFTQSREYSYDCFFFQNSYLIFLSSKLWMQLHAIRVLYNDVPNMMLVCLFTSLKSIGHALGVTYKFDCLQSRVCHTWCTLFFFPCIDKFNYYYRRRRQATSSNDVNWICVGINEAIQWIFSFKGDWFEITSILICLQLFYIFFFLLQNDLVVGPLPRWLTHFLSICGFFLRTYQPLLDAWTRFKLNIISTLR